MRLLKVGAGLGLRKPQFVNFFCRPLNGRRIAHWAANSLAWWFAPRPEEKEESGPTKTHITRKSLTLHPRH
jgi:hypothetical protein